MMGPLDSDVASVLEDAMRRHKILWGPATAPPRPKVPEYLISAEEAERLETEGQIKKLNNEVRLLKGQIEDYEEQIELRDTEKTQILGEYIAVQTQLDELLKALTT